MVLGLLSPGDAAAGVAKGLDVYLFLVGTVVTAFLSNDATALRTLASTNCGHQRQA